MINLFKDRNFICLMSGKLVSLFGNAIYDIGLVWYFLTRYGEDSGGVLAWVMVLGILPPVISGGLIGYLVDRFNKKYIMIISDLSAGIAILVIVGLMHFNLLGNLYLLSVTVIISLTASFVSISVNSLIPELFSMDRLQTVNSVNQFVERGTSLAGFSLGGILIGMFGVEMIFLLNAASFIISAVSEMFIVNRTRKVIGTGKEKSILLDYASTFKFIRENKNLLWITLLFSFVNFLWDPLISIVFPYVLKNDFIITSAQFGILQAALPAGFCIGAMYFSNRKSFINRKHVLFYSILGVNFMLTLAGVPILFSRTFRGSGFMVGVLIVILMISGWFSAAINISTSIAIQTFVPEGMLGKYWAFSRSLSAGLVPIGAAVMGALLGKVPSFAFFAFSILGVFVVLILLPRDRYAIFSYNSPGDFPLSAD